MIKTLVPMTQALIDLKKQGGDKLDAQTDWNRLICLVDAELIAIKDILNQLENDYVTQDEFLEYKVYLNEQMAIYNQFMEEINSYNLEEFIPNTNFRLVDLQEQIDDINSQLESINAILNLDNVNMSAYYKVESGYTTNAYVVNNVTGKLFPSIDVRNRDETPYHITSSSIAIEYLVVSSSYVTKDIEIKVIEKNSSNLVNIYSQPSSKAIIFSQALAPLLLPFTTYIFELYCDGTKMDELELATLAAGSVTTSAEGCIAVTETSTNTLTIDYECLPIEDVGFGATIFLQIFTPKNVNGTSDDIVIGQVSTEGEIGVLTSGTVVITNAEMNPGESLDPNNLYIVTMSSGSFSCSTYAKTESINPIDTDISTHKIDITFEEGLVLNENYLEFLGLQFNGLNMLEKKQNFTPNLEYEDYTVLEVLVSNNVVSYIVAFFQRLTRNYILTCESLYNGLAVSVGLLPINVSNGFWYVDNDNEIFHTSTSSTYMDSFVNVYHNGVRLTKYYDYTIDYSTSPEIHIVFNDNVTGYISLQEQYR